ncbi:hypothetical protein B0H16DRAFT_1599983 [Mycena metata]|uniref:Uncharacterized protein n=1 Tax=Mycena metata TaxID=1033252 RepID=A0AAD7HLK3_9AGAR|nr:hypothetical protein B0H16DRAFT_1599983 [Mycena metata]
MAPNDWTVRATESPVHAPGSQRNHHLSVIGTGIAFISRAGVLLAAMRFLFLLLLFRRAIGRTTAVRLRPAFIGGTIPLATRRFLLFLLFLLLFRRTIARVRVSIISVLGFRRTGVHLAARGFLLLLFLFLLLLLVIITRTRIGAAFRTGSAFRVRIHDVLDFTLKGCRACALAPENTFDCYDSLRHDCA